MKLSEYLISRDNNFNLIRMLAAIAVIFSHSFILANGPKNGSDPLAGFLGMPVSGLAVNVFFITSGMLVAKSLLERKSVLFFLVARGLRIFPALIVAVIFCAVVVGGLSTSIEFQDYILHKDTILFVVRNVWLFDNVIQYSLPGVFETLPYKHAVNGSLWTLPWEVYSYASLLIIYLLAGKYKSIGFYGMGLLIFLLHINNVYGFFEFEIIHPVYLKLLMMFYVGVLFYLLRNKLVISWFFLVVSIVIYSLISHHSYYKVVSPLFLTYWTLSFAYLIRGGIKNYNRLGDLSYGTYIYAFPVQQLLVFYFHPSGWNLFLLSTLITLVLAYFSWNLVEKRALSRRDYVIKFFEMNMLKISSRILPLKGTR